MMLMDVWVMRDLGNGEWDKGEGKKKRKAGLGASWE